MFFSIFFLFFSQSHNKGTFKGETDPFFNPLGMGVLFENELMDVLEVSGGKGRGREGEDRGKGREKGKGRESRGERGSEVGKMM